MGKRVTSFTEKNRRQLLLDMEEMEKEAAQKKMAVRTIEKAQKCNLEKSSEVK